MKEVRRKQNVKSQTSFRRRKKEEGAAKLQVWVNSDIKDMLLSLSQITGKTQQKSIEYAINLAYNQQANEVIK